MDCTSVDQQSLFLEEPHMLRQGAAGESFYRTTEFSVGWCCRMMLDPEVPEEITDVFVVEHSSPIGHNQLRVSIPGYHFANGSHCLFYRFFL